MLIYIIFSIFFNISYGHVILLYPPDTKIKNNGNNAELNLVNPINTGLSNGLIIPYKKDPCGGYIKTKHMKINAGDIINVTFASNPLFTYYYNNNVTINNIPKPYKIPKNIEQVRHGGGTCEFGLTYDMKNYYKIGKYTKSCTDIYYEWPIKIPINSPPGKSVFMMSWITNSTQEIYMSCSNIYINNKNIYNIKQFNYPKMTKYITNWNNRSNNMHVEGDTPGSNLKGIGPLKHEIILNINN